MSYEFTKLPEVEILESLSNDAHLIVEDEGKTRRFPASEFSGGDAVLDENGRLMAEVLPNGYPYDGYCALTDEVTVVIDEPGSGVADAFSIELVAGQTYTVICNGVEYECVCVDVDGASGIGNGTIWNMDFGNNEPFFIRVYSGITFINTIDAGTYTIKIFGKGIRKMDKKFLPSITTLFTDGDMYLCDLSGTRLTKAEVIKACENNIRVVNGPMLIYPTNIMDYGNYVEVCGMVIYNGNYEPVCAYSSEYVALSPS